MLVFGHSHVPWDTTTASGLRLLNPGSPTDRRRQPRCTYMTARVTDGALRGRGAPRPAAARGRGRRGLTGGRGVDPDRGALRRVPQPRRQSSVLMWEPAIGPIWSIPPSTAHDAPVT